MATNALHSNYGQCSTYGKDKNAYKVSVGNRDRKRPEGYIKIDFEEVGVRVQIKYISRMY